MPYIRDSYWRGREFTSLCHQPAQPTARPGCPDAPAVFGSLTGSPVSTAAVITSVIRCLLLDQELHRCLQSPAAIVDIVTFRRSSTEVVEFGADLVSVGMVELVKDVQSLPPCPFRLGGASGGGVGVADVRQDPRLGGAVANLPE
jgi:hypothetical protein